MPYTIKEMNSNANIEVGYDSDTKQIVTKVSVQPEQTFRISDRLEKIGGHTWDREAKRLNPSFITIDDEKYMVTVQVNKLLPKE